MSPRAFRFALIHTIPPRMIRGDPSRKKKGAKPMRAKPDRASITPVAKRNVPNAAFPARSFSCEDKIAKGNGPQREARIVTP